VVEVRSWSNPYSVHIHATDQFSSPPNYTNLDLDLIRERPTPQPFVGPDTTTFVQHLIVIVLIVQTLNQLFVRSSWTRYRASLPLDLQRHRDDGRSSRLQLRQLTVGSSWQQLAVRSSQFAGWIRPCAPWNVVQVSVPPYRYRAFGDISALPSFMAVFDFPDLCPAATASFSWTRTVEVQVLRPVQSALSSG
jgi:hypothetical protein